MRALCSLVLLLSGNLAHAVGYKAVKDWVGGCDNTRHCSALGLAKADAAAYALLHFERGPAADDEVRMIRLRVDQEVSRAQAWTLQADGAELLKFSDIHLVDADSGPGIDFLIEADHEIAAVMAALRRAQALVVTGADGPVGEISLSGASAIMLWIDEQQGRLGTTTALVRQGAKPPQSVPPAVPLPILHGRSAQAVGPADAVALGADVRRQLPADSCEDPVEDSATQDSAWLFDDGRTLVQLLCFRGAYNFGSSWFLIDAPAAAKPDGATQLSFPTPGEDGTLTGSTDQVNADFDPKTGRLFSFNKGRGIGDCGSAGEWVWNGQAFQLASYQMMGDCRGVTPDLWPHLWRSQP